MQKHTLRSMAVAALAIFVAGGTPAQAEKLTWKAVLATGDDSIKTFDNARKKVKEILEKRGVDSKNIRELSVAEDEVKGDVEKTTPDNIARALTKLGARSGDACLFHITSHGSPKGYTYIKPNNGLVPEDLDQMLTEACGDQPTVVLISACYSGVFTAGAIRKPNRVILTAARDDRPSFGCHSDYVYTYWDGCLIETLPTAKTWAEVYKNTTACVTKKEEELAIKNKAKFEEGVKMMEDAKKMYEANPDKEEAAKELFLKGRKLASENPVPKPSYPQAFAGSQVKDLELPN